MTQLEIWQIGLNTSSTCKLTISDAILYWMYIGRRNCKVHARSVFIKALAKICVAVIGNFGKRSLCWALFNTSDLLYLHNWKASGTGLGCFDVEGTRLLYLWGLQFDYSFLFWRTMICNRDFDPLKTSSYEQ